MMTAKPSDLVSQSCKSFQAFQEASPHIKGLIKTGDLRTCKEVVSQIKKLIKDRKIAPQQKVLLLDLFHECVMQKVPNFLNYAQEKILERLSILAAKKPLEVFRDSSKSPDNMKSSEDFIKNLLKYIQIWARDFGKGSGGQTTFYGTIYTQLRAKVSFPPIQTRASFNSEPARTEEVKKRQTAAPKVEKSTREILDYLDNVLTIIEEIENPNENETGKELISNVVAMKGSLDDILNKALNKDDAVEIDRVLNISERIQTVIGNKKPRASLYTTAPVFSAGRLEPESRLSLGAGIPEKREEQKIEKKEEKKEEKKTEKKEEKIVNIFDDILNLDIETFSSPPPKAIFNTHQPSFPDFGSPFLPVNGPKQDEERSRLEVEVKELKSIIIQKDEMIEALKQQNLALKTNIGSLEDALNKTKSTLLAKEKECQESHVLKTSQKAQIPDYKEPKTSQKEPNFDLNDLKTSKNEQILDFNDLKTSQKEPKLEFEELKTSQKEQKFDFDDFFTPLKIKSDPVDSPADNDHLFKFITCEEMAVVYDSVLIQVGYQLKFDLPTIKMICYVGNRSADLISNINIEPRFQDFQLSIDTSFFPSVSVGTQAFFVLTAAYKDWTSRYPRLVISCVQNQVNYSIEVKVPINICQFGAAFPLDTQKIWQDWEDLLFASENCIVKCDKMKSYIPKLLKLGPNSAVFSAEQISKIGHREFLMAVRVKEMVFAMVRVKRKEPEIEIEVRSNEARLRKCIMELLVSNLAE